MHKVVIHPHYGAFRVSPEFIAMYREKCGVNVGIFGVGLPRHDPLLVTWVESLGDETRLEIMEIDGDQYRVEVHDGIETIRTPEYDNWITIR